MHIIRAIASMFGWVAGLFRRQKKDDVLLTYAECQAMFESIERHQKIVAQMPPPYAPPLPSWYDEAMTDTHIDHFGDHGDQIGQGDG